MEKDNLPSNQQQQLCKKQLQNLSIRSQTQIQNNIKLNIVYNLKNLNHKSSKKHPQCPQRVTAIIQHFKQLKQQGRNIFKYMKVIEFNNLMQLIKNKTQNTNIEQHQESQIEQRQSIEKLIIQTHNQNYYQFIKEMWDQEFMKKPEMYINMDTYYMKNTYQAAFAAVQTMIKVVDLTLQQNKYSFAVIRPPGHHSGMKSQPHGFSFFNNLAIGVNYALKKMKKRKIAIIDWDVHHGEGTQKIFYQSNQVLFISMHRYDNGKFFPHVKQSSKEHVGLQKGEGFNVNVCWNLKNPENKELKDKKEQPIKPNYLQGQTVGDLQYICCFQKLIIPILKRFQPQMIFVSCGFDSAQGDPIGSLSLTSLGFKYMTYQLMKMNLPIIFALQGGYNIDTLKWASQCLAQTLCLNKENQQQNQKFQKQIKDQIIQLKQKMKKNLSNNQYECNKIGEQGIQSTKKIIQKYWKI